MTGNLVLYANFFSPQAQTISFSPPAMAAFPGPSLALSATATSGLAVSFAVVSGPATLSANQLSFTGAGSVVVQASQSGNANWLPAPPVNGSIQVNFSATISRIRFNALGRDARVVAARASVGDSLLWDRPGLVSNAPLGLPSTTRLPVAAAPASLQVLPPVCAATRRCRAH